MALEVIIKDFYYEIILLFKNWPRYKQALFWALFSLNLGNHKIFKQILQYTFINYYLKCSNGNIANSLSTEHTVFIF